MGSLYDIARRIANSTWYLKKNLHHEKDFSFGYFLYRVGRPLLKVNYKIFKSLNPETPWTSQAAIRIFSAILSPEMVGFEYGSGQSTLFFSRHLKRFVSVEHDKEWFARMSEKLKSYGITNVEYHLIPPSKDHLGDTYRFQEDFNLKDGELTVKKEFHNYFSFIKTFPDNSFDFIMVDGRARVECCLNALSKLKPGGIFVLDNSDRKRYIPIFHTLKTWKQVHTTTGLFDTTFWFKPDER